MGYFLPFYPLNNPEKNSWWYHFTHGYHKYKSYDAWFLRYGVQQTEFFFSFWTILCPFTPPPLTTQRIKILKKWKETLETSSFYSSVPWMAIIWYMVPEISTATDKIFFVILGDFLAFYPNIPKNENLKKMKQKPGYIIILHNCTKSYDYRLYCSWDMVCDRCKC